MNENDKIYSIRDCDTRLTPGQELKIEHSLSFLKTPPELAHLISLPAEAIQAMRDGSVAAEQKVFDDLKEAAKAWETYAAQTQQLDMVLEYHKTPEAQHTANEWAKDDYNNHSISNKVYQMSYNVYEETKYDRDTKTSEPVAWHVTWGVYSNHPNKHYSRSGVKITGQNRKRFTNKADMEKYLNGRIKAYSHLFTEISPPIPKEYEQLFQVNGQLLPGYSVEGDDPPTPTKKPSLSETLKANADKSKAEFDAQSSPNKTIEMEV